MERTAAATTCHWLYLLRTNTDPTESRGVESARALVDSFETAQKMWVGSGVMGTSEGASVYLVPVYGDDLVDRAVPRRSTKVIGSYESALGWRNGVVPLRQTKMWPAAKRQRFAALRRQFPDTPLPDDGPSLAESLPTPVPGALAEVFALVLTRGPLSNAGRVPIAYLSLHTNQETAVACAKSIHANVCAEGDTLSVLRLPVGEVFGPVEHGLRGGARVVWSEPAEDSPELVEYKAMLRELAADA